MASRSNGTMYFGHDSYKIALIVNKKYIGYLYADSWENKSTLVYKKPYLDFELPYIHLERNEMFDAKLQELMVYLCHLNRNK
jgi:hypothetical protein